MLGNGWDIFRAKSWQVTNRWMYPWFKVTEQRPCIFCILDLCVLSIGTGLRPQLMTFHEIDRTQIQKQILTSPLFPTVWSQNGFIRFWRTDLWSYRSLNVSNGFPPLIFWPLVCMLYVKGAIFVNLAWVKMDTTRLNLNVRQQRKLAFFNAIIKKKKSIWKDRLS